MSTAADSPPCDVFNLSIDELRILAKYRALANHQRKGILQAIERLRPSRPSAARKPAHLGICLPR